MGSQRVGHDWVTSLYKVFSTIPESSCPNQSVANTSILESMFLMPDLIKFGQKKYEICQFLLYIFLQNHHWLELHTYWNGWPSPVPTSLVIVGDDVRLELSEGWFFFLFLACGIVPCPGIEPKSPTWQADSFQLSHKGSPRILEWVAHPFSRGSSGLRNQTRVSCIASGSFTKLAVKPILLSYNSVD